MHLLRKLLPGRFFWLWVFCVFIFVVLKVGAPPHSPYALVSLRSAELQQVDMSGALVWEKSCPAARGMKQAAD